MARAVAEARCPILATAARRLPAQSFRDLLIALSQLYPLPLLIEVRPTRISNAARLAGSRAIHSPAFHPGDSILSAFEAINASRNRMVFATTFNGIRTSPYRGAEPVRQYFSLSNISNLV